MLMGNMVSPCSIIGGAIGPDSTVAKDAAEAGEGSIQVERAQGKRYAFATGLPLPREQRGHSARQEQNHAEAMELVVKADRHSCAGA